MRNRIVCLGLLLFMTGCVTNTANRQNEETNIMSSEAYEKETLDTTLESQEISESIVTDLENASEADFLSAFMKEKLSADISEELFFVNNPYIEDFYLVGTLSDMKEQYCEAINQFLKNCGVESDLTIDSVFAEVIIEDNKNDYWVIQFSVKDFGMSYGRYVGLCQEQDKMRIVFEVDDSEHYGWSFGEDNRLIYSGSSSAYTSVTVVYQLSEQKNIELKAEAMDYCLIKGNDGLYSLDENNLYSEYIITKGIIDNRIYYCFMDSELYTDSEIAQITTDICEDGEIISADTFYQLLMSSDSKNITDYL